jgi:cell fate regulator YaaT (PSP1 superfamily)
MDIQEYLLSYGCLGDFGRFRPTRPLCFRRGDRAVVRSHRGLEIASVLCPARPGHAHFLPNTSVGQLLRPANEEDERAAEQMQLRAQRVFEDGQALRAELNLPLQLLDVEVLLDGRQAILHLLRFAECDVRPFVSGLSRRHELQIVLQDLTQASTAESGCGRPNCGKKAGGCDTCGSGGGCGSCGAGDLQAHFAELRQKMEQQHRVGLL